ncbi:hypothetical protein MYP_2560 [Sporocytophaga myxococcoides]|uniref:Uncharacterized protein n=1 Tax=Sporocytophaga myxococcoides TaxID=153721 RepID=A0A098LEJ6_9BACT|nr:hypothetical protein [Sporocytophaga myxococcoides]GAL85331.1 hypothetical protein MYP_2560 [Sporocytophaga myxococcoides]
MKTKHRDIEEIVAEKERDEHPGLSSGLGEEAGDFMADTSEDVDEEIHNGLSSGEGEEGGDFIGTGKIKHQKNKISEGQGSAGSLPYEIDYNKVDTGRTGSNVAKDRNLEKSGSGEA